MNLREKTDLSVIILFLALLANCSNKVIKEKHIRINPVKADSLFQEYGSNIAIINCLRCGCFVDEYNKRFRENHEMPQGYVLLTDTSCNKFLFPVKHLSNRSFDDLSEDIYNLTFLRKSDTGIVVKILKIDDSKKVEKISKDFFK